MLGALFISNICNAQISFHDSGQNLGNSTSSKVALGDIDNDGDLDAIVSNWNHQITQNSKIWINDGTGLFSESTQTIPPTLANASLGDFDGDSDLDFWMDGRVWINDGNGNFSQGGYYAGGFSASGDLDADGDLDVFISYGDGNINYVYLNDGSGHFTHSGQNIHQRSGNGVALGDLDNDGDLDAYVIGGANFENPQGEPDKVWFNDGTGMFHDSRQELGNYQAGGVALGDMDGDGDLDALVANWHPVPYPTNAQPNQLWINDGKGNFTVSSQDFGKSMVSDVALEDLDGDGDLDAFIANGRDTNTGKANEVRVNIGNGQFHDPGLRLGNSPSLGVALGDVDSDGDHDAFIANCGIFDGGHPNKVWLIDSNVGVEYYEIVPAFFDLKQNYPNPFNSATTIQYSIAEPCYLRLSIFNMLGQRVKTLVNEFKGVGNYSISFDATGEDGNYLSSGIYIYQISIGEIKQQKRMILVQ